MSEKEILIYDLHDGINAAVIRIRELLMQRKSPDERIIVLVAGGSSSGKTTQVSEKIAQAFSGNSVIIHGDNYYHNSQFMKNNFSDWDGNWDDPRAVDLAEFKKDMLSLKAGNPIIERPDLFSKEFTTKDKRIKPGIVNIGDSLFTLDDKVRGVADIKIFVEIDFIDLLVRRLLRDTERFGQNLLDILRQIVNQVWPSYLLYIEPKKKFADIIIKNPHKPSQIPSTKLGERELQIKFPLCDKMELIKIHLVAIMMTRRREAKCSYGTLKQQDIYYQSPNNNLAGEVIYIRKEILKNNTTKTFLRFKILKENNHFLDRFMPFEIEITNKRTEELLLSFYKNETKLIIKERGLYIFQDGQFNGLSFVLDQLWFTEEHDYNDDGLMFAEIRFKEGEEKKAKKLIKKLGLQMSDAITKSYFEM